MTELKCKVQQYAWGKLGTKSLAAEFAASGRPDDFCINGTDPYAELWMGTHPNGPSMLKGMYYSTNTRPLIKHDMLILFLKILVPYFMVVAK